MPPNQSDGPDDENPFVAFRQMADRQIASFLGHFNTAETQEPLKELEDRAKRILKYKADLSRHAEATEDAAEERHDFDKTSEEEHFKSWLTMRDLEEERRRLLQEGTAVVGPLIGLVSDACAHMVGPLLSALHGQSEPGTRTHVDEALREILDDEEYHPDTLRESADPRLAQFPWHQALSELVAETARDGHSEDFSIFPPGILHLLKRHVKEEKLEPLTELDYYLGEQQRDTDSTAQAGPTAHAKRLQVVSSAQQNDLSKPDILSTLTTTRHTTSPDGRTITRTVCKRTFSDGREEVEETTHESQSRQAHTRIQQPAAPVVRKETAPKEVPEARKGGSSWFWSW